MTDFLAAVWAMHWHLIAAALLLLLIFRIEANNE